MHAITLQERNAITIHLCGTGRVGAFLNCVLNHNSFSFYEAFTIRLPAPQFNRWLHIMKQIVIFFLLVAACVSYASRQDSEFDRVCQSLAVRPQVARALGDFQANRGGDNRKVFELLRAFCMRRQQAAPRAQHPELADPLLDTNSLTVLMGSPDGYCASSFWPAHFRAQTKDPAWVYYFNPEKTWHLELTFKDGMLLHTSYRQLISADELINDMRKPKEATNKPSEATP